MWKTFKHRFKLKNFQNNLGKKQLYILSILCNKSDKNFSKYTQIKKTYKFEKKIKKDIKK